MSRWFVVALCLCVVSLLQGRDVETTPRPLNAGAGKPANAGAMDSSTDGIFLVRGENGSGSAFAAVLWGKKVIISNAHVYLECQNPAIYDSDGNQYHVTRVRASLDRDLVVLDAEGLDGCTPAKLHPHVTALPMNAKVFAAGNSLGDDVITFAEGVMNGVGPEKIEITAGIVPGNSGGPVFIQDGATRYVVGVSTYLRTIKRQTATEGTRFSAKDSALAVRRFATRIDNIKADRFEEVSLENIKSDCLHMMKIQAAIKALFRINEPNLNDLKKYLQELTLLKQYTFHSTYMSKSANENINPITEVLARLVGIHSGEKNGSAPIVLPDKCPKDEKTVRKIGKMSVKCPFCKGGGKLYKTTENTNNNGRISDRIQVASSVCQGCYGSKRLSLYPGGSQTVYSGDALKKIDGQWTPISGKYNDFVLGGDIGSELERLPYYDKSNLRLMTPNSFGANLLFKGNHVLPDVDATLLIVQFEKLVGVVLFSAARQESSQLTSGAFPLSISTGRCTFLDIYPVTRSGEILTPWDDKKPEEKCNIAFVFHPQVVSLSDNGTLFRQYQIDTRGDYVPSNRTRAYYNRPLPPRIIVVPRR